MNFRTELTDIKRIVVKVGSAVITKSNGYFERRQMRVLVEDICALQDQGIEVILVSSGAVNLGKRFLTELKNKEHKLEYPQAAAAIGQPQLMREYAALLLEKGRDCAQILLTQNDFRDRQRFLNAKKTVETLLQHKIIPILNENDSVAFSDVTLGDNDHLAASAAQMLGADLLLIITSAEGLFDRDPEHENAQLLSHVSFEQSLQNIDMQSKTDVGRGGMSSKVDAILKVTPLGIPAILASKQNPHLLFDPLMKEVGTFFEARNDFEPEARKAWLISTRKQNSRIEVDKGAYEALKSGKSLLAKGVAAVNGSFFNGDCVEISFDNQAFALGLSEYTHDEIEKIKNCHSDKIEEILGYKPSNEVIHTNNVVILKK